MRSAFSWFSEFCHSRRLSHFAASFIVTRAEASIAENCDRIRKSENTKKNNSVDYYANSVRGYSFFFPFQIFMGGGLFGMKNVPFRYHFRTKPKYTAFVLRQLRLLWRIYNFQWWMSRFERRWRAQRSAISIVNCRIPWADRDLNTYCAFGISLKAYVLQCLFILILNILLYV